jgi:hypothetical protein
MGSGYPLEFTPYLIRGGYDEQTEFINKLYLENGIATFTDTHLITITQGIARSNMRAVGVLLGP